MVQLANPGILGATYSEFQRRYGLNIDGGKTNKKNIKDKKKNCTSDSSEDEESDDPFPDTLRGPGGHEGNDLIARLISDAMWGHQFEAPH